MSSVLLNLRLSSCHLVRSKPLNCFRRSIAVSSAVKKAVKKQENEDLDDDKPVKFTTSGAYKAQFLVDGPGRAIVNKTHPITPWSVVLSIAVFLTYFCALREENDIDQAMTDAGLYEFVKDMNKAQLEETQRFFVEKGIDTRGVEERLREIE